MNIIKLKEAEQIFMARYPEGFADPEMLAISKKHKMEKMIELAQTGFSPEKFKDPEFIVNRMAEIVTKSSMVSIFEKPKFRDYTKSLSKNDQKELASALGEMLHGEQEQGFEALVHILARAKLEKWTIVTVFGACYSPKEEVFVKPTTTKNTIAHFELEGLEYKPRPSYAFYKKYRSYINTMKREVDKSLSPSNAAFTGFLMMFNERNG